MNLRRVSDKKLCAELARRDEARRALQHAEWQEWASEHPCPDCGALPDQVSVDAVEEYRFAPRDSEAGTTGGLRYERNASCPNGHRWFLDEFVKWFDEPWNGPPILTGKK